MRRLVLVELTRFRSRRAIVLIGVLAVLLAVVLAGVTAYQTRPLSAADRANARAQAELGSRDRVIRDQLTECRSDPRTYLGPDATGAECASRIVPSARDYYPRRALDLGTVVGRRGLLEASGFGLALLLTGLMIVAGCTFAGADWRSGALGTQLLFEARRTRLWLAKALAVVAGSAVVSAVTLAGFWGALFAVAASRGIEVSSALTEAIVWHAVRAVALAVAAALGGFALTMVFRHTVATLGLLFVYSVGGEIALGLLPVEGAGKVLVGNNVFGWLGSQQRYFDPSITCSGCDRTQVMTHLEAGLFLGALLLVAVTVSLLWFRRREV